MGSKKRPRPQLGRHDIQSGNAWIFILSAIPIGALHGLEPGHSKTMLAAFIVAVRGTVGQAVLLGLAATLAHTAVVWAVAMGGLYFRRSAEATEPYFQVASAALIILIALWMLWRTWREQEREQQRERVEADHKHDDGQGHGEERRRIDTGHGIVDLEAFEDGAPI